VDMLPKILPSQYIQEKNSIELTARVSRSCGYNHPKQKGGVVIALSPSGRSLHNRASFRWPRSWW